MEQDEVGDFAEAVIAVQAHNTPRQAHVRQQIFQFTRAMLFRTHPRYLAGLPDTSIVWRRRMKWSDLVAVLEARVPAGSVTTYAEVSTWAYGSPNLNQPVRSLLRGSANHGHLLLTNRVVAVSGLLADLPEGREQQEAQLRLEGVPMTTAGAVDFSKISPVALKNKGVSHE